MLAVLIGCGGAGDGGDEIANLTGTWAVDLTASCAAGFTFAPADEYEIDVVCSLTDGTIGMQAQVGVYVQTADALYFNPRASTCAGTAPSAASYSVSGQRLTIVDSTGILTLQRLTPSGAGAATFGCFMDGLFTERPLTQL